MPDPKRRSPATRPGRGGATRGRGRGAKSSPAKRGPAESRALPEPVAPSIKASVDAAAEHRSEQRLGFTARRAAIMATVLCVLTLTLAGPVRTYFAQRAEQQQLAALAAVLERQYRDLRQERDMLQDEDYIKAQARERLGYVMPGETPYQVQIPATADAPAAAGSEPSGVAEHTGPWYSALWQTIADQPHNPSPPGG